jgi:hypothetical protein
VTDPTGGHNPPNRQQSQSTPETAKQEATALAQTAAERGGQVGDTAGEQVRRVASETGQQARDLLREGRDQLHQQAKEGQRKAAGGLHALADQLNEMAEKTDGEGLAPEVVRQAAERTRGVANWIDGREPGALLGEVRAFARRRPGVFLAGAALAGVLAGRLTRSAVAAASDDSGSGAQGAPAGRHSADPAPVPSANPMPGRPAASPSYSVPPPVGPPAGYSEPATTPTPSPVPRLPANTPSPSYSVPPAPPVGPPGDYPGPVTR